MKRILLVGPALLALLTAPVARADDTPSPPPPLTAQDQQYLNGLRANGISGGQDDTLIAYAHEFCAGLSPKPSGLALVGQGVGFGNPGVFYAIQTIAARTYCPDRVPIPYVPFPPLQTPGPSGLR